MTAPRPPLGGGRRSATVRCADTCASQLAAFWVWPQDGGVAQHAVLVELFNERGEVRHLVARTIVSSVVASRSINGREAVACGCDGQTPIAQTLTGVDGGRRLAVASRGDALPHVQLHPSPLASTSAARTGL